ncbi:PaaI family thioesterase [Gordonia insulae]|nr:PaaI family thioesterase [Gordonia insulae]
MSGQHPPGAAGFSDGGERPWRSSELSGGAEYSAVYGDMIENLGDFLDRLAEAKPDPELLESLSAVLGSWARKLEPLGVRERDRVFGRRTDIPGRGQTMSPTIVVTESDGDSVSGTVRFGPYFLGGNNAAHGGTIPLMFDEILGRLANSGGRPPQRTAYLHTDFRSITPIARTLQLRAWLVSEEGRKRILKATLHDGDILCAEAEGLFVALRPDQP